VKRLLALVLLWCSCGHQKQPPPETYARVLSLFRQGELIQARDQARSAAEHCEADLPCRWRFRLLEAEILIWLAKNDEARALLTQSLPAGSQFTGLRVRRQMLEGYLLAFTQREAGLKLVEQAYQQAIQFGLRDILPEIEILKGSLSSSHNPEEARALFFKAREHAIEQHDGYDEAAALNDLGMLSLENSRYDEAIPFFEQALDPAKHADARQIVTAAYINLGLCYTQLGAYDLAVKYQQEALTWIGTTGSPVVRRNLLSEMGRTLQLKGELPKAIQNYRAALALSKSLKPASDTWISADNLASALAESQDWDAAAQANREESALAGLETQARPKAFAALNAATIAAGLKQFGEAVALYNEALRAGAKDPSIRWEADAGLARAHAGAGNKLLARRYFERALETIDENQAGLSRDEYKLTFLASLIRFYRDYVDFLMQNGESDKALEVVESSRARVLAETVTGEKTMHPLTVPELQRAARRSGTIFLSYWLAPRQSYVWVISPAHTRYFALGPAGDIESLVERFRQSLPEWDLVTRESADAARLYKILIGPVASFIPAQAHVVIVPDGALSYLNFETLPVPGEKPHYWIEDVTVAVAPSLAIAAAAPGLPPAVPKSLLVIGDPVSSGNDFPLLSYAAAEISKVRSHFPAAGDQVITGPAANPASYRQANPQRFSVIHFSAHGEANPQSPLDSAIILSPKDGAFKLYARDVIDVPIHAELVTISACRSAGARVYSGEGLVGFAWAFLKAGARYVVAGLWDVTDRSTPDMMDDFYGAIQAGKTPVEALRVAKLAMIHSTKAIRKPYYWGPFQIYIR
jgi:CHAT domain-containing protein